MFGKMKWLTLALAGMLAALPVAAGVPDKKANGDHHEVALLGIGGQNRTWGGFGGGALQANLPVWKYLDIQTGLQGLSTGVMTGLLQLQPILPLKKGELFADVTSYYGGFYKYGIHECLLAGSIGWRNAHFSVQAGLSVRWIMDGGQSSPIVEPVDPFYRIAYRVKASDAPWNLTAGVANYSRYQVERAMQPIFFLEGSYRLGQYLSLMGEVYIKPVGMFHLVASWYGFSAGIGLRYRFGL